MHIREAQAPSEDFTGIEAEGGIRQSNSTVADRDMWTVGGIECLSLASDA